jgi:hypothetical protein
VSSCTGALTIHEETPLPEQTTAQRLSAYYDELVAAGFNAQATSEIIQKAAPADLVDVDLQADLEDKPLTVGGVVVDIVTRIDPESLARVRDEIEFRLKDGVNELQAALSAGNVLTEEMVRKIRDEYGDRNV